jgi:putative spermidine/putrescine transport system substrate-binding protein
MKILLGRLGRREFLLWPAVTGLILPEMIGTAFGQGKGPINFLTWGGNFGAGIRKAFLDPFTASTGIQVREITPFSYGKFQTAMKNSNPEGYDLVWFDDEVEPVLAGADGTLEKLDYSKLPKSKGAIPGTMGDYAVAPYVTVYMGAYRSDRYKGNPPKNWADFWNAEKFPGNRSLGTWVGGVLEAALMADGVEPAKLYPLDEARAFRSLDRLKPYIRTFHDTQSSTQAEQMLYQGDISMVLTWATDFIAARNQGKPVDVIYNQGFYFSPAVGIAKGSKYAAECYQILNSFFDPDQELAFINAWPTTPAQPIVAEKMTELQKNSVALTHIPEMVHLDREWYAKNQTRVQHAYDSWRV